jgi:riboflavin kinase/FMN adenylyltransferase
VPTANLDCARQLIPDDGVYIARCTIGGTTYPAALSVGTLPTFGDSARQVEAHLIGFSGDLYGQTIDVEVLDWLREQRKYSDIAPLQLQIARDVKQTIERAAADPARPINLSPA